MSSKSAVKLLAPTEAGGLFRWVALLTGSKNAVKGVGFLLGAALLATLGFIWAVLAMAAVLAVILVAVLIAMPPGLPKGRKGAKFSEVFSKSANVNWLSRGARVPVRRARCLVRGRHPDLFLRRAVGWHRGGQPRRLLHDRHLHGGLDHPLRRGAGRGAPAAARSDPTRRRADRRGAQLGDVLLSVVPGRADGGGAGVA